VGDAPGGHERDSARDRGGARTSVRDRQLSLPLGTTVVRESDTLPFGCFRRDLFERVAVRRRAGAEPDEEFSFRVLRAGGRVLLVTRRRLLLLRAPLTEATGRMFYQYGFFKPLVALKIGRIMTLRQLVPAAFVLSVLVSVLAAPWVAAARVLGALILGRTSRRTPRAPLALGWRHGRASALLSPGLPAGACLLRLWFLRVLWRCSRDHEAVYLV